MILLIDNYDSFTYNLYQMIAPLIPVQVVRNDKLTVADVIAKNPSGVILSPGPGRPENAGICLDLLRHPAFNYPVLGVCLGHQAIVSAFGGTITAAPTIVHGKHEAIFHHQQGLYQDLPLPLQAGRYHSLIAKRCHIPSVLTVEAETADGLIMGVRHIQRPIFGVQFHPESILTPQGHLLLQNFIHQNVMVSHVAA